MNIYEKGGATFRKDERGDFLINPSTEILSQFKDLKIINIEINDALGVIPNNLGFLSDFSFIEGVSIITSRSIDISALHNLKNLRTLNLSKEFNQVIDFSHFRNLISCQISWNDKIINFGKLRLLEHLILTGYKKNDLSEFEELISLKTLSIIQSTIVTLKGIGNLKFLEQLELVLLKRINSLEGIEQLQRLKKLHFENCPNISDLGLLKDLHDLEVLLIHDGKNIQSLKPLKNLYKLKTIYLPGNTNIVDGDMSPLIGRVDASFGTRKHYSHKADEIDKINGTVRPKQSWDW